jgi:hypothetical protein
MPRLEVNLGEMPQPVAGAIRSTFGSSGATVPRRGESHPKGFVPLKQPPKPPCCKTCKDRGCVGHCKF